MTTEYKRVKHAQRDTEANAVANVKTRENRLTGDTKRWISKLEDGTQILEGGYSTRFVERYGTIAAAITAFGADSIHAISSKALTLTANATLPENVVLEIRKGAVIDLNGFTLTLGAQPIAGDYQIFSGAGSVVGLKVANIKWFGAKGDGIADDADPINTAIATGAIVRAPAGSYRCGSEITLDLSTGFIGRGEGLTILIADHTGTAFRVATNNKPILRDFKILRNTVGAVGSRTGIGLDVFGDIAGGSSVQAQVKNVWIQGFSKGLQLEGCFLSSFKNLTMKRNDQTYYFKNNTNDSIVFENCASNLAVKQHLYANGGAEECGATFINCEFENSEYMPAFEIADAAKGAFFNFRDCYSYENNFGTFAGSSQVLFLCNVPSHISVSGSGWSAGSMANARNFWFRNTVGSALKYQVSIHDVLLSSDRTAAAGSAPIDMDASILTDFTHKIQVYDCFYNNTNGSPYPTICDRDDTQRNNEFFGIRKLRGMKLLNHTGTEAIDSDSDGNTRWLSFTRARGHWVLFDGSVSWHVWVTASGQLRIKNGAPSSDTDGDPAAYTIPKLQTQVAVRSLTPADYTFNQWLSIYGPSAGEIQMGSGGSGGVWKWGNTAASANFAYSALNGSERSFTVTGLSPNMVIPRSTFTVGANTYTVICSDATKVYVVEDNSAEAAAGTLTGLKTITMRAMLDASGYLGIGGTPSFMLHVQQSAANDMNFKFSTPKTNGLVQQILQNDARAWHHIVDGAVSTDNYKIRDTTQGVDALDIEGGKATNAAVWTIADGPKMVWGTGSPETVVTAPVGSLFMRTDGGASTTLYVKESGTGNTGWIAK